AFGLAARDADRTATLQLGELSDHAADGTGSGGHQHGLASFGLAMLEQPDPGRDAGHACHAEIGGQRNQLGVDLHQALTAGDRIGLPAEGADDEVAGFKPGIARLDYFAYGPAHHDLTDLHRLGVRL